MKRKKKTKAKVKSKIKTKVRRKRRKLIVKQARLHIRLESELLKLATKLLKENHLTMSGFVRASLENFVDENFVRPDVMSEGIGGAN